MKKLALLALFAASLCRLHASGPVQTGTVTIDFLLGQISDNTGAAVADGSLLQVIASYDSTTFAPPTAGSFLGGSTDETVLWQGAFDSATTGIPGAMTLSLASLPVYSSAGTPGNFYLSAGESVIVRWYPALSGTSVPAGPGTAAFGQYGYTSLAGALLDSSWVVPSAGSTVNLSLVTASAGGALPNADGYATNTVPVPEPAATVALLGAAALLLGLCARHRRS